MLDYQNINLFSLRAMILKKPPSTRDNIIAKINWSASAINN